MKTKQLIAASLLLALTFNLSFAQQFYSNGERITGVLHEKWGATSAWENDIRYAVTYSTPTNVLLTQENWNGFSWEATRKSTIILNANYAFNLFTTQVWDGTQAAWRNKERTAHTYFNNDPSKTLVYKRDTANAANNALWDDYERQTYTYNANGLELQDLQERKNGSTWKGVYKGIYTYNANSLKTSGIWYRWQPTGYWWSGNRRNYYYNANSLLALTIDSSNTNTATSIFTAHSKLQFVYNASNLVAQELETYYNPTTNTWNNYLYSKRTNTYNAQNLLTQQNYEFYDTNLGGLAPYSTGTNTYNAQNLLAQSNYERYNANLGSMIPDYSYTYTYNNANNVLVRTYISQNSPSYSRRTTYTYGNVVGTEQAADLSFAVRLFPNPTAEQINITLPNNKGVTVAMIMAANGQMLKAQNLTDTQSTINVSDLAAGSYQILLLNGGKSAAKTFVKQ